MKSIAINKSATVAAQEQAVPALATKGQYLNKSCGDCDCGC